MAETKTILPELTLRPHEEDRALAGHLWIFSNELQAMPALEPGSLVRVLTARGAFLGTGFYNPKSLIAVRLLSRQGTDAGVDFFLDRFERALEYRRTLYPGEESFRLVYGEADGLPGLTIDKYGNYLVAQVLAAGMDRLWPAAQEALVELLKPAGILLRNDNEMRKFEGLEVGISTAYGEVPDKVEISEGDLRFRLAPASGQKTGFYLDQRENRAFLRPFFKGKTVVDLYCYVGTFAAAAAKAGAERVLGVDSSEAAVQLARESAFLNNVEETCKFEEGDAEQVLNDIAASSKEGRPDFILVDPPSLVPNKKSLPQALKAYSRINSTALKCLSRGGYLASSTCSHHVDREAFVAMLRDAARKAGRQVRLIALRGQAADHPILLSMPETEYLHFALLQVV